MSSERFTAAQAAENAVAVDALLARLRERLLTAESWHAEEEMSREDCAAPALGWKTMRPDGDYHCTIVIPQTRPAHAP